MRRVLPVVVALLVISCGGGSPTQPPTNNPPPTPQNSAPTITAMSVSPQFGIQQLTLFVLSATATDANNDALTYTWNICGGSASGSSASGTFNSGGTCTATVTVTDGKGGSVSDSRTFVVGSATGTWTGSGQGLGDFTMTMTQSSGFVTGTYQDAFGTGQIDPAQPGTINAQGQIEMRVKQGRFSDWTLRGTMSQTGRQITGGMFGSGFTGQAFVMSK
jgi:hypothetical protein